MNFFSKKALPPVGSFTECFNFFCATANDTIVLRYNDFIGVTMIKVYGGFPLYYSFHPPNAGLNNQSPMFESSEFIVNSAGTSTASFLWNSQTVTNNGLPQYFNKPIWTRELYFRMGYVVTVLIEFDYIVGYESLNQ